MEGRTRRRSQWVFWERGVREVCVGGIIQRMTRETVGGLGVLRGGSEEGGDGGGGVRERRCRV